MLVLGVPHTVGAEGADLAQSTRTDKGRIVQLVGTFNLGLR